MHYLAQLTPDRSESSVGWWGVRARLFRLVAASLGVLVWLACAGAPQPSAPAEGASQPSAPVEEELASFIVQGRDLSAVIEAVREVGGEMTHELGVIRAVGARLTAGQRAELEALDVVTRVWEDRPVSLQTQNQSPSAGSAVRRGASSAVRPEAGE